MVDKFYTHGDYEIDKVYEDITAFAQQIAEMAISMCRIGTNLGPLALAQALAVATTMQLLALPTQTSIEKPDHEKEIAGVINGIIQTLRSNGINLPDAKLTEVSTGRVVMTNDGTGRFKSNSMN